MKIILVSLSTFVAFIMLCNALKPLPGVTGEKCCNLIHYPFPCERSLTRIDINVLELVLTLPLPCLRRIHKFHIRISYCCNRKIYLRQPHSQIHKYKCLLAALALFDCRTTYTQWSRERTTENSFLNLLFNTLSTMSMFNHTAYHTSIAKLCDQQQQHVRSPTQNFSPSLSLHFSFTHSGISLALSSSLLLFASRSFSRFD